MVDAGRDAAARTGCTRGRRGHGAAARLEAQTRRVTNLIQLATIFAEELQADPELRRALLERSTRDATSLAVTLPRHPADVWLVVGARALFTAGRFFDGEEARGWVDSAIAILWRQLRELVHDDGGLRDRSPARHALVARGVPRGPGLALGRRRGDPGVGAQAGRGMAYCLARLLHPERRARAGRRRPLVVAASRSTS